MKIAIATAFLVALATGTAASNIYVGNNGSGPVTIYTSGGAFVQNFGQSGATGTAINSTGNVWTAAPDPITFQDYIVEYTPSQMVVNSFVTSFSEWVSDMSHGWGNTLYLSTWEGFVWTVNDQTGAIINSFPTPNNLTHTGVAFDGAHLWLTGGTKTDAIYEYTTTGTVLQTIPIATVCAGIGYDVSDGTLWCGDLGAVHHYTTGGILLGSFNTLLPSFHDGVETPNLVAGTSPEPSTLWLAGTGLAVLLAHFRKRA